MDLSAVSIAYTLLKDTIKVAIGRSDVVKRNDFQQKIIFLQKCMIEIINNGEAIFDRIKKVKAPEQKGHFEELPEIKSLAASQIRTISRLKSALTDDTWYKLFELLMPDLRTKIRDPMYLKGERLRMLLDVDDLEHEQLIELYDEQYETKGRAVLSQLKKTAQEVSLIIREKIPLEDLSL